MSKPVKLQFNVIYYSFLVLFAVCSTVSPSYVWEGNSIVKRVFPRYTPTILHGVVGARSNLRHLTSHGSWPRSNWNSARGFTFRSPPIPPTFVTGAQVHDARTYFGGRMSTKPKRWMQAVAYVPEQDSQNRSDFEQLEPQLPEPDEKMIRRSNMLQEESNHDDDNIEDDSTRLNSYYPTEDQLAKVPDDLTFEPASQNEVDNQIQKEYLSGSPMSPNYFSPESESYKVVMEKEYHEPMRPVRRSSNPWPYRDTDSLGQPRHEACNMQLDRGVGPDELSSWYYDHNERRCRWFGYRGYGGNANRFYSRLACEEYCLKDMEDLCQTVTCPAPGLVCTLVDDRQCKEREQHYGRDWRQKCPPDHPVCTSPRGTRFAPNVRVNMIPPECFLPKDSGSCEKKNPMVNFYYDSERNTCMTFYFHSCGGNDNRFETKSDCMTHCSP